MCSQLQPKPVRLFAITIIPHLIPNLFQRCSPPPPSNTIRWTFCVRETWSNGVSSLAHLFLIIITCTKKGNFYLKPGCGIAVLLGRLLRRGGNGEVGDGDIRCDGCAVKEEHMLLRRDGAYGARLNRSLRVCRYVFRLLFPAASAVFRWYPALPLFFHCFQARSMSSFFCLSWDFRFKWINYSYPLQIQVLYFEILFLSLVLAGSVCMCFILLNNKLRDWGSKYWGFNSG